MKNKKIKEKKKKNVSNTDLCFNPIILFGQMIYRIAVSSEIGAEGEWTYLNDSAAILQREPVSADRKLPL